MPAIGIRGLRKCYNGVAVVDGVDLTVPSGEFFGLLGPNGAGKTTTLRMLLGLTPIDEGEVQVLGHPIPECEREVRLRLGVVPQFDTLDPDFTVEENLFTYASYFGLSGPALERRVGDLLELANLESRRQSRIDTLSGGMKRRLTLARALVNAPELVILDEPTTGLDPQARHHLWRQLRRLRERGVTLVLTTHYMEEAEELCDRVAIIDRGRIIACDSPRALIAAHVEPWVISLNTPSAREFLAERGDLPARMHEIADTWLIYTADPAAVRGTLEAAGLAHSTRAGNLEDVFLKLTGHELRD
ncbi:ABC transporter ATP-binding protein [Thioalkalivibrio nitratireducens]|uniref:ABC transporter ATP-binding protein n=1 Tax=Thioalkalivibrio nitratireducens TaxID=186931 RepID=UPI0005C25927|nr:ATP-binding cassette domain-containing protein [Thioalkalivibrio nitratireducens]